MSLSRDTIVRRMRGTQLSRFVIRGRKSEGGLQADPLRNPHGEGPLNWQRRQFVSLDITRGCPGCFHA